MAKAKALGMEEIAAISGKCRFRPPESSSSGVEGIADQRVSGGGKMNAHLVRPTGLDDDLQKAGIDPPLHQANPAYGALPGGAGRMDRTQARMGRRPDGHLKGKVGHGRDAGGQRQVDFSHGVPPHGCAKSRPGPRGAGEEHHSRRASPEAMDRGGFRVALSHQGEECMLKEPPAGEGRKPTGLCHGQQIFVFVKHRIGKRRLRLIPGRAPPDEHLAKFQNSISLRLETIQNDFTMLNALLPHLLGRVVIASAQIAQDCKPNTPMVDSLPILESPVKNHFVYLPPLVFVRSPCFWLFLGKSMQCLMVNGSSGDKPAYLSE